MSLFLRQRRDGSRAPGYAVYLLAGLAACLGIGILHQRSESAGGAVSARNRRRLSDVAPITQPAALMSRVDIKNKPPPLETRSYRLENTAVPPRQETISPPANSFDAIGAALMAAPSEAGPEDPSRPLDESSSGPYRTAVPVFAELPPSLVTESPKAEAQSGGPQLIEYRDASADGSIGGAINDAKESPIAAVDAIVPRGTLIYVYLLTAVDTSNPAAVLQFASARAPGYHRYERLRFGTRFLGKLNGPPARDRLNLSIDTVLFPDGLELPISATAVEADELGGNIRPGVAANYFPPPGWAQIAPYVSDFATGYLSLLESRAQRQFSIGLGGALVPASTGAADVRPPLYEASAQAIQDFTQARLKELSQRYASYYLIPAGTACWLEVEADLDLNAVRGPRGSPLSFADHP